MSAPSGKSGLHIGIGFAFRDAGLSFLYNDMRGVQFSAPESIQDA